MRLLDSCDPPAGVATSGHPMADQLQLWADAELPDRKRRRVAHEVQEILHAFGVGVWLDKAAWGSSCHRVEEA